MVYTAVHIFKYYITKALQRVYLFYLLNTYTYRFTFKLSLYINIETIFNRSCKKSLCNFTMSIILENLFSISNSLRSCRDRASGPFKPRGSIAKQGAINDRKPTVRGRLRTKLFHHNRPNLHSS